MSNDNLKTALQDAGIEPAELAEIVRVDERSVRRWLGGLTPYAKHRGKIAKALGTTEHELWPELPTPGPPRSAAPPVNEIVGSFADAEDPRVPDPELLVSGATDRIDILDDTVARLLSRQGLPELLAERASNGCQVRILAATPTAHLAQLLEQPGIEIRALDAPTPHAIHRYDHEMLVTFHLGPQAGNERPAPVIHLRRQGPGGMFDRLSQHYSDQWQLDGQTIGTDEELKQHILPTEDSEAGTGEASLGLPPSERASPAPSAAAPPAGSGRRWPRRPK